MNRTLFRTAWFSHLYKHLPDWYKHYLSGSLRGRDVFPNQLPSRFILQNRTTTKACLSLQDENGVNRPVCSYVRVLRGSRLLESPRQAARFVSLLAHEKAPVVGGGGGKQEQWCTLLSFLCRGKVSTTGLQRAYYNALKNFPWGSVLSLTALLFNVFSKSVSAW